MPSTQSCTSLHFLQETWRCVFPLMLLPLQYVSSFWITVSLISQKLFLVYVYFIVNNINYLFPVLRSIYLTFSVISLLHTLSILPLDFFNLLICRRSLCIRKIALQGKYERSEASRMGKRERMEQRRPNKLIHLLAELSPIMTDYPGVAVNGDPFQGLRAGSYLTFPHADKANAWGT